MEKKAEIEYRNDKERMEFILEQNHKKGYEIHYRTEEEHLEDEVITHNFIEAWGLSEEEKQKQEAERTAKLSLTAADVERALYKAFGKDFEDIIAMVSELKPEGLDIKELKIELKANNFYRGNPYVDAIGSLLGINSEQLDEFFETNDYTKLFS